MPAGRGVGCNVEITLDSDHKLMPSSKFTARFPT